MKYERGLAARTGQPFEEAVKAMDDDD